MSIECKCALKTRGAKPAGLSFSINHSHCYVSVDVITWLPSHLLCVSYYVYRAEYVSPAWTGMGGLGSTVCPHHMEKLLVQKALSEYL